jgi:hypothetical protein
VAGITFGGAGHEDFAKFVTSGTAGASKFVLSVRGNI